MAGAAAADEAPAAKRSRKRSRGKHRGKKNGDASKDDGAEKRADDTRDERDEADDENGGEPAQVPSAALPAKPSSSSSALPPASMPSKKRKAAAPAEHTNAGAPPPESGPRLSFYERVNPHKPSAMAIPSSSSARTYTISVALPGSIVLNAQTPELQARLAGQIARTCAIFNVDEIVVFDEGATGDAEGSFGGHASGFTPRDRQKEAHGQQEEGLGGEVFDGKGPGFDPNTFLARILQYLETPQYLRKPLFPMHRDLRLAGLLPPLDCPHHLRFQDRAPYREGVIVDGSQPSASADSFSTNGFVAPESSAKKRKRSHPGGSSTVWVNVGLQRPIEVDVPSASSSGGGALGKVPELGTRVTVRMVDEAASFHARPTLVSPREPVEKAGLYWGYTVRLAPSLGIALTDAPTTFGPGGEYDRIIGTSERGTALEELLSAGEADTALHRPFRHAIIVLGGLSGLEDAVERDAGLDAGADEAHALFDVWVNLVEAQGSRTIRTEEAIMIALARLKGPLERAGRRSS